jgi:hypothetical protein
VPNVGKSCDILRSPFLKIKIKFLLHMFALFLSHSPKDDFFHYCLIFGFDCLTLRRNLYKGIAYLFEIGHQLIGANLLWR